jgi:hypothetical protein
MINWKIKRNLSFHSPRQMTITVMRGNSDGVEEGNPGYFNSGD